MSVSTGYDQRQALCCECGNLRTCRRPKNYREENFWLNRPVDRSWHRETGDLKCEHCARTTRHALLYREGDQFKNHAERLEGIALGLSDPLDAESSGVTERIKKNYRIGRQTNPHLRHSWWSDDAEEARAAGKSTVVTLCGDQHEIPDDHGTYDDTHESDSGVIRAYAPRRYRQVFSDDAPPEGWDYQDCPDCTRVVNEWVVACNRKYLMAKLAELMRRAIDMDAPSLERLIVAIDEVVP
jgi:hypothetical protein